jgi:hypothetical protein
MTQERIDAHLRMLAFSVIRDLLNQDLTVHAFVDHIECAALDLGLVTIDNNGKLHKAIPDNQL